MNPLETYLKDLRDIRSTGAAVAETSFYPALSNLLNEIGKSLKPKVRCVINIANRGAGLPDGGLFTAGQFQKASDARAEARPAARAGRLGGQADRPKTVEKIARSEQVERYCAKYGLVLVTNLRDFLLLGREPRRQAGADGSVSLGGRRAVVLGRRRASAEDGRGTRRAVLSSI